MGPSRSDALAGLQAALDECIRAGIEFRLAPFYKSGDVHAVIVLFDVEVCNGKSWLKSKKAGEGAGDERG